MSGNSDMELRQYSVSNIEGLENFRERGRGCYGAVYEVRVNGVPCIAKRIHNILLGREGEVAVSREEKEAIITKFREECLTLSKLRHPNIVQFMGVHFGRGEGDITLIMESVHMDLEKCIRTYPNIPLSFKLSILRDIAYGLSYLHSLSPNPVIHRDLNQGNVLLTEALTAKIVDLGASKVVDYSTQSLTTMTAVPGAMGYMPPEAMQTPAVYDTKLDCFSFGNLLLYVLNGKFPELVDANITLEDVRLKEIQIAKRRASIVALGPQHILSDVVKRCLSDVPSSRPSSIEIVKIMEEAVRIHPKDFQNILDVFQALQEERLWKEPPSPFDYEKPSTYLKDQRIGFDNENPLNKQSDYEKQQESFKKRPNTFEYVKLLRNETDGLQTTNLKVSNVVNPDVVDAIFVDSDVDSDEESCVYDYVSESSKRLFLQTKNKSHPQQSIPIPKFTQVMTPQQKQQSTYMMVENFMYGRITREVACNLCQEYGEFLIRDSPTTRDLVITARQADECRHITIHQTLNPSNPNKVAYSFKHGEVFDDLDDLMSHVMSAPFMAEANVKIVLLKPVTFQSRKVLKHSEFTISKVISKKRLHTLSNATLLSTGQEITAKVLNEKHHDILIEGNVLRELQHPNIIKMIGVCVSSPVCILLEESTRYPLSDFLIAQSSFIDVSILLKLCYDICLGMVYLHSKDYIHRKLAARNCIINSKHDTAKIANFERAYFISDEEFVADNSTFAIGWAAFEVLNSGRYSKESDVWSFGVLVWEVFSQGGEPYPGLSKTQVIDMIEAGAILELPEHSPAQCHKIIDQCFRCHYKTRPTFDEIVPLLETSSHYYI